MQTGEKIRKVCAGYKGNISRREGEDGSALINRILETSSLSSEERGCEGESNPGTGRRWLGIAM